MVEWLMNVELEKMWKKRAVVYFKVICCRLTGQTERISKQIKAGTASL
jgi:hypothetical protein